MIEKLKDLMLGKTIESLELQSYQSTNDILFLNFTDKTHIKIMSDPDLCFDGLAFYISETKNIEIKKYEKIK